MSTDSSYYCSICGFDNDCHICTSVGLGPIPLFSTSDDTSHPDIEKENDTVKSPYYPCRICGVSSPYPGYLDSEFCYCGNKLSKDILWLL
jgi:hypothetical protein